LNYLFNKILPKRIFYVIGNYVEQLNLHFINPLSDIEGILYEFLLSLSVASSFLLGSTSKITFLRALASSLSG